MEKCCVDKECACKTDIEALMRLDNDWNFNRIISTLDEAKIDYVLASLAHRDDLSVNEREILRGMIWAKNQIFKERSANHEKNESMPVETILQQAQLIVDGQRRDDYGDMRASFKRIAGMWSSYLGTDVNVFDVAHMMIMLKLSRNHDKYNRDSMVDVCGYAYCADRIHDDELAEKSKFNGEY